MDRFPALEIDPRSRHRYEGMVVAASCSALIWAALSVGLAVLLPLP